MLSTSRKSFYLIILSTKNYLFKIRIIRTINARTTKNSSVRKIHLGRIFVNFFLRFNNRVLLFLINVTILDLNYKSSFNSQKLFSIHTFIFFNNRVDDLLNHSFCLHINNKGVVLIKQNTELAWNTSRCVEIVLRKITSLDLLLDERKRILSFWRFLIRKALHSGWWIKE